jgi:hypothetical protein
VTETLLLQALSRRNPGRPPVWFMRQAGRYHRHYQALRARHEFIDLCKQPRLAAEVTLGPIEEFGFDAAILFSDLLFPLEAMGMGLRYAPGPTAGLAPAQHRRSVAVACGGAERAAAHDISGRGDRTAARAPAGRDCLIGFVGGPFTLYAYAVAGSHEGFVRGGLDGLDNGLYAGFNERLCGLCWRPTWRCRREPARTAWRSSIRQPARSRLSSTHATRPPLAAVMREFRARCPGHAGDLLFPRYRPGALGGAARRRLFSVSASTGGRTWSRCCARRLAVGACRATSIRSGCCCPRASSSAPA